MDTLLQRFSIAFQLISLYWYIVLGALVVLYLIYFQIRKDRKMSLKKYSALFLPAIVIIFILMLLVSVLPFSAKDLLFLRFFK